MKKSMDVDFYKKHDFGDEMREAVDSGRGFVGENMTPDQFFAMARARSEARKAEKATIVTRFVLLKPFHIHQVNDNLF